MVHHLGSYTKLYTSNHGIAKHCHEISCDENAAYSRQKHAVESYFSTPNVSYPLTPFIHPLYLPYLLTPLSTPISSPRGHFTELVEASAVQILPIQRDGQRGGGGTGRGTGKGEEVGRAEGRRWDGQRGGGGTGRGEEVGRAEGRRWDGQSVE